MYVSCLLRMGVYATMRIVLMQKFQNSQFNLSHWKNPVHETCYGHLCREKGEFFFIFQGEFKQGVLFLLTALRFWI